MNEKQKAKAFDIMCEELSKKIEEKIPDWLLDNPFWEIDDEDCRHYPKTTSTDAREALCDQILEQADNMGLYDFFELVLCYACHNSISAKNSYLEKIKEDA